MLSNFVQYLVSVNTDELFYTENIEIVVYNLFSSYVIIVGLGPEHNSNSIPKSYCAKVSCTFK